jgi:hypothetical protein
VSDCESCTILYEDGVNPDTFNFIEDPKCSSCEICLGGTTSSFAYNCANVPISGPCVVQTCGGVRSDLLSDVQVTTVHHPVTNCVAQLAAKMDVLAVEK